LRCESAASNVANLKWLRFESPVTVEPHRREERMQQTQFLSSHRAGPAMRLAQNSSV
jgi:hypothetical protein